ncbi:hypothetical protein GE09DRAFT_1230808 [Coniochaeta sp. 2T2.1]|nr:hypothetical protein GE09DRAFT_1230808 [Coniochaeta sp. 2T2.1]
MSKRNTEKPSSKKDDSPFGTLGDEGKPVTEASLVLQYYLEEGQPDFTDRLVHGHPAPKKNRVKKLSKTMKDIDNLLAKSGTAQNASQREATNATNREETTVSTGSETWEQDGWNCPSWSAYRFK